MTNPYRGHHPSRFGVASDIVPVTPDDDADLPKLGVALYVETAGAVAVLTPDGGAVVRVVPMPAYGQLPIAVVRVLATGTTCTGIHVLTVA